MVQIVTHNCETCCRLWRKIKFENRTWVTEYFSTNHVSLNYFLIQIIIIKRIEGILNLYLYSPSAVVRSISFSTLNWVPVDLQYMPTRVGKNRFKIYNIFNFYHIKREQYDIKYSNIQIYYAIVSSFQIIPYLFLQF